MEQCVQAAELLKSMKDHYLKCFQALDDLDARMDFDTLSAQKTGKSSGIDLPWVMGVCTDTFSIAGTHPRPTNNAAPSGLKPLRTSDPNEDFTPPVSSRSSPTLTPTSSRFVPGIVTRDIGGIVSTGASPKGKPVVPPSPAFRVNGKENSPPMSHSASNSSMNPMPLKPKPNISGSLVASRASGIAAQMNSYQTKAMSPSNTPQIQIQPQQQQQVPPSIRPQNSGSVAQVGPKTNLRKYPQCRALYDFDAAQQGDLGFKKGDLIDVVRNREILPVQVL
jgi:hypothetical protein